MTPCAQSPLRASSSPVVEAFVVSFASSPQSQRASRSGTSAMRSAASSAAEPSSASSWKTVLIGIVWMPVAAYSSLGGHALERPLDHARGPLVAVVERQAEHPVAPVEQRVVDAPRVHADPGERAGAAQALERLGEQVQEVPAQAVGQPDGPVVEAVHLRELHAPVAQAPRHDAPAGGAEVDGGVVSQGGRPPRGARALSAARSPKNCGHLAPASGR